MTQSGKIWFHHRKGSVQETGSRFPHGSAGQYLQLRAMTDKTNGYTGVFLPTSKFTSGNSFSLEK